MFEQGYLPRPPHIRLVLKSRAYIEREARVYSAWLSAPQQRNLYKLVGNCPLASRLPTAYLTLTLTLLPGASTVPAFGFPADADRKPLVFQ